MLLLNTWNPWVQFLGLNFGLYFIKNFTCTLACISLHLGAHLVLCLVSKALRYFCALGAPLHLSKLWSISLFFILRIFQFQILFFLSILMWCCIEVPWSMSMPMLRVRLWVILESVSSISNAWMIKIFKY